MSTSQEIKIFKKKTIKSRFLQIIGYPNRCMHFNKNFEKPL